MGNAGKAPQSSTETTDQILRSYAINIPDVLRATSSQATPLAQSDLAAAQAVAPGYAALDFQNTDAQNRNAEALLAGSGGDVARGAKALDDSINPEYAAIRSKAATQTGNLLDSINLSGLSGGERAEVERALGQSATATGNLGIDNATNAVSNAMSYGDRLAKKRAELGNIVNSSINFMGTKNATFNPVSTALTQGNTVMPSSNNAFQFGQGALGNVAQATGAQNALTSEYNWKNSSRYALGDIGANS
jgi:hypothetical protein